MNKLLSPLLENRKLLILGFGREGQSTFHYIRKHFPGLPIGISDRNPELFKEAPEYFKELNLSINLGAKYLESLSNYQLIIKSPGVALPEDIKINPGTILTSQTHLMLEAFHRQIIGITGTKGKSTTSSLIHHLLKTAGIPSILVGNIGLPPFDHLDQVDNETRIVFELSSHQLEDSILAPHIAVLLNLYPEHLDRYPSLEAYYSAKMRILSGQLEEDIFIYNEDIPGISERISQLSTRLKYYSFSSSYQMQNGCYLSGDRIMLCLDGTETVFIEITGEFALKGNHNRMNMMAALLAARNAGAGDESIRKGLFSFQGLEHRLEYVGEYKGIHFYNDSIATIPEATIAAVRALPETDTLILGGYDRMLNYITLIDFLIQSHVRNFIFLGESGLRIYDGFQATGKMNKNLFMAGSMEEACELAFSQTSAGKICLLSPAAASYDSFKNFEERGRLFKKIARGF
ncbi:MAG: UDP-N-acetylmuramoyl-L-alanine--D-glutamate ligase [Bacteroidales bacterium]